MTEPEDALLWGSTKDMVRIAMIGGAFVGLGLFFRLAELDAIFYSSVLVLTGCAVAALVRLCGPTRVYQDNARYAFLTLLVPLSFSASAFAAEAPFESHVLGITGQVALPFYAFLACLAVTACVLLTIRAEEHEPSRVRGILLGVFFAATPVASAIALYGMRSIALTTPYPPTGYYVLSLCLIPAGLVAAFVASGLAEVWGSLAEAAHETQESIARRMRTFSQKLLPWPGWYPRHHHSA